MKYWVHVRDRSGPYEWRASGSASEVLASLPQPMEHEAVFLEAESGHLINLLDVTRLTPWEDEDDG